jgi:heme exporter protein A
MGEGQRALLIWAAYGAFMRLHAEDLSLIRGGRRLFSGLSFDVLEGEALVVSGSNGAGKSSLFRAIAGFLHFSSGKVRLEGDEKGREFGDQTHYLGHADSLRTALTAEENLAFCAELLGAGGGVEAALTLLGLFQIRNFPVRALSTGQKRRVALARLLVAPRKLWLLDEPTTALDAGSQHIFAAAMRTHLSRGGLIIAATHATLAIEEFKKLDMDVAALGLQGEVA